MLYLSCPLQQVASSVEQFPILLALLSLDSKTKSDIS